MNQENKFLIFVVEYYRNKKNRSGKEIIALFDKYNVWELEIDDYVCKLPIRQENSTSHLNNLNTSIHTSNFEPEFIIQKYV